MRAREYLREYLREISVTSSFIARNYRSLNEKKIITEVGEAREECYFADPRLAWVTRQTWYLVDLSPL